MSFCARPQSIQAVLKERSRVSSASHLIPTGNHSSAHANHVQYMSPPNYPPTHPSSIHASIYHLSIRPSVHPSTHPPIHPSTPPSGPLFSLPKSLCPWPMATTLFPSNVLPLALCGSQPISGKPCGSPGLDGVSSIPKYLEGPD